MAAVLPVVAEDDYSDVVALEVESHSTNAGPELDHLSGLYLVEAHYTRDAVSDADDCAVFADVELGGRGRTSGVMFMILSMITLPVSPMLSFFEKL